jgi:hypothetical protein
VREKATAKIQPKLAVEDPAEKEERQKNLSDLEIWKEKNFDERMQIRKSQIDEIGEGARAMYASLNDDQFNHLWRTLKAKEESNPQIQVAMLYGDLKKASQWQPSEDELPES